MNCLAALCAYQVLSGVPAYGLVGATPINEHVEIVSVGTILPMEAFLPAMRPQPRRNEKPRQRARQAESAAVQRVAYAGASLPKTSPFQKLIGKAGATGPLKLVKVDGNEVVDRFDPSLVRLLREIQTHYRGRVILVQSGYRSPAYNAALAKRSRKVAKNSLHMRGMAADIRVQGVSPNELLSYLKSNPNRGGLGWFMTDGYIHVDTGRRRTWRY